MTRERPRIDTAELNARLLAQADSLVAAWLPAGRRQGKYVKFGGVDGSAGESAWVDLDTGAWRDEASPADRGGDLISLYAALRCGGDNKRALLELAAEFGARPGAGAATAPAVQAPARAAPKPDKPAWQPLCPVPADAPDYRTQWAHFARGVPDRHWEYRGQAGELLLVVCLFRTSDGGKEVQPLSWCTRGDLAAWKYKAPAEPRPLYGLQRLQAAPGGPVYVVEGEKCADALHEALGVPVLTWQGGASVVRKADWSPLCGRPVVLWPDADAKADKRTGALLPLVEQPGMRAMLQAAELLRAIGCEVSFVDIGQPGERPDGWDCADAIAEGWTREQLQGLLVKATPSPQGSAPARASSGSKAPPEPAGTMPAPDSCDDWRGRMIWNRGQLRECVPNVIEVLTHHEQWRGVVGFDEFAERITKLADPPYDPTGARSRISRDWTDVDDTLTAAWLAQHEGLVVSSSMVAEAVNVVARLNGFHPVREYLASLPPWDRTERLDHWLADHLHVAPSEYVRLVGRWFLMAMVARVLQPGVKFDYCLVLEGKQGRYKSTALRLLAGEWFSDTELDLANKDSMSAIGGKWLHEFGEMGSIARSESQRQKSFLSRQFDEYRPVYGRREIRRPRQLVFAGTTNEWNWQKDPTGGRRFWPVAITHEVNVDGLRDARDLLFAEAYARVLAGERFWPNGEEQRELFDPEQLSREAPNTFAELLAGWLAEPLAPAEFTMADACVKGLKLEPKGITRDIETRVGQALAKLGCEKFERRTAAVRHWYRRPPRQVAAEGGATVHELARGAA